MPSATTEAVYEGEIEDFESFAWRASRAFLPVTLESRGDLYSRPDREALENVFDREILYWSRRIEEHKAALQKYKELPDKDYQKKLDRTYGPLDTQQVAYFQLHNDRLQKMLGKVEAWQPPTPQHVEIKDFMIEQLRKSTPYEPRLPDEPAPTVAELRALFIKNEERCLGDARDCLAKAKKSKEDGIAWVDAFEASIKGL